MTPTEATLKLLRAEGYLPQVVEQTVYGAAPRAAQEPAAGQSRPGRRQVWKRDLFGIGDVLGVRMSLGPAQLILVQTTSSSNVAARRTKILTELMPRTIKLPDGTRGQDPRSLPLRDVLAALLRAGVVFELHGWGAGGAKLKRLRARLNPPNAVERLQRLEFVDVGPDGRGAWA